MEMEDIKPIRDAVLVEVEVAEKIGDIYIPEESRKGAMKGTLWGHVKAVGHEVRDLLPGDTVLFYKHQFTAYDAHKVHLGGNLYGFCLLEKDVLAKLG